MAVTPTPVFGQAIKTCHAAGIVVKMITGDHAVTALSIARQIVTRHGGEIWVANEPRGATICFTIPVAPG